MVKNIIFRVFILCSTGSRSDDFSKYSLINCWVSIMGTLSIPWGWTGLVGAGSIIEDIWLSLKPPLLSVNCLEASFQVLCVLLWLPLWLAQNWRNWWVSCDVSRAWATLHFELVAHVLEVFLAELSGHSDGAADSVISWSSDTKGSAHSSAFHLFPVSESGPVWVRLIILVRWAFICSSFDTWQVVSEVIGLAQAGLRSLRSWLPVLVVILDSTLISSDLWSWRNACWCVFLITWWSWVNLRVVDFIFVSVNIGTSWVDWWSFVTSFYWSSCLPWCLCSSWWHVVSLLTLVMVSWRSDLRSISNTWWNSSDVPSALDSWCWSSLVVLLSQFGEVDCVILYLIFSNCWKISTLKLFNSLWSGMWKDVEVLEVELALEFGWWVDVHACWSLEWSVLVLGLWESFCDLA